ncbi:hypothetical protein ACQJBY_009705 [Aegilops geniculata]
MAMADGERGERRPTATGGGLGRERLARALSGRATGGCGQGRQCGRRGACAGGCCDRRQQCSSIGRRRGRAARGLGVAWARCDVARGAVSTSSQRAPARRRRAARLWWPRTSASPSRRAPRRASRHSRGWRGSTPSTWARAWWTPTTGAPSASSSSTTPASTSP